MAGRRNRAKMNIPMCIGCILLCLTMVSVHLTSGLYARYATSSEGSDGARVISFGELSITETGDFVSDRELMIIPGVNLTKKAVVDFSGSESAVYVFVEVKTTGWTSPDNRQFQIPAGSTPLMSWEIDAAWTYLTAQDGSYIYYKELLPNTVLSEDIIKDGSVTVSDQITKVALRSMTGLTVGFRAVVVQSGGFENVQAAWNSIAAKGE